MHIYLANTLELNSCLSGASMEQEGFFFVEFPGSMLIDGVHSCIPRVDLTVAETTFAMEIISLLWDDVFRQLVSIDIRLL